MNWITKTIIRIIVLGFIGILLSTFEVIYPNATLLSTLYTVCGIMFSIGLSLIVTFNLSNIRNKRYLETIEHDLKSIRDSFMWYFAIATIAYIGESYLPMNNLNSQIFQIEIGLKLNWWIVFFILILFSIIYFIMNFIALQKLNSDIYDKINEEQN